MHDLSDLPDAVAELPAIQFDGTLDVRPTSLGHIAIDLRSVARNEPRRITSSSAVTVATVLSVGLSPTRPTPGCGLGLAGCLVGRIWETVPGPAQSVLVDGKRGQLAGAG